MDGNQLLQILKVNAVQINEQHNMYVDSVEDLKEITGSFVSFACHREKLQNSDTTMTEK